MARLKELQDKVAKGEATQEEIAELNELKVEAKAAVEADEKEAKEEDAAVARLAEKIADSAMEKLTSKLGEQVGQEKSEEGAEKQLPKAQMKHYIVDRTYGKVTPDELDKIQEEIPQRKNAKKKQTTVSGRTKHFFNALLTGDVQKLQVLTEGTPSAGGYLVPEDFLNMIVEDLRDATVMRQVASQMNTTVDTVHLPKLDTRPQAAWRSEGAVKLTSTAQFSELVFTPYSLASIVPMSQELADDAQLGVGGSIVNYIAGLMVQALAEKEDKAFWTGDGSGQPTGVSNYTIGGLTKSSNFADDIIDLYNRYLKQGYRSTAVWVGNSAVLSEVRKLKGTDNHYLVQNVAGSPFQTLMGRPMYEQNDLGNELYLGDFSYYQIVDRQGISVRVSDEATVGGSSAFEKNLVFVRVEKRVDGELTLTEAVKKISGI